LLLSPFEKRLATYIQRNTHPKKTKQRSGKQNNKTKTKRNKGKNQKKKKRGGGGGGEGKKKREGGGKGSVGQRSVSNLVRRVGPHTNNARSV